MMRPAAILALIIISLMLLPASLPPKADAQPTWNLMIRVLKGEYYMGEWGTIYINITNMDCVENRSDILSFRNVKRDYVKPYVERAEAMKKLGVLRNYTLVELMEWNVGTEIYGDYDLHLIDACKGRPIKVLGAGIWFPWREFGKTLKIWKDFEAELNAFDAIEVVEKGNNPTSSIQVGFKFFFPPDIHPDDLEVRPLVDVKLDFPGWMPYTLEDLPTTGELGLQPYRTFNLTITGFDGINKLAGAKVVMKQLIYYYNTYNYTVPMNGTIRVKRLLDTDYDVYVYWNSSYVKETVLAFYEQLSAYELASSGIIKTRLFNLKINPLDLSGRPLKNALIIFGGFPRTAANGTAIYNLVPQGNYSAQIYWKGMKIFDGWLWVGYHPTIYPWMTRPARVHDLKLPVADLKLQAVDSRGEPVGANFTVIGPTPETSFKNIYSRNGSITLKQMPIANYKVKIENYSSVFNLEVNAEAEVQPGEIQKITLPIHSLRLKIVSFDGETIPKALVRFGPIDIEADDNGIVTIRGVPSGRYDVEIRWKDVPVYKDVVNVSESSEKVLKTSIYNVFLKFFTSDGKSYRVLAELSGPSGIKVGLRKADDEFAAGLLPEGDYVLKVFAQDGRILISRAVRLSKLFELGNIYLPVADMRIWVGWSDEEPIQRARIQIMDFYSGKILEKESDAQGCVVFHEMPFATYRLKAYYPFTRIKVYDSNVTFGGGETRILVEFTQIQVRVVGMFDNPLNGVEVSVSYHGEIIASGRTDARGWSLFRRVPLLEEYEVKASYMGSSSFTMLKPPQTQATMKLQALGIGGQTIGWSEIETLLSVIIVAAIITTIIITAIKLLKKMAKTIEGSKSEQE